MVNVPVPLVLTSVNVVLSVSVTLCSYAPLIVLPVSLMSCVVVSVSVRL